MPAFEVKDQNSNVVSSRDLLGKKTVIYFYPKDNTSDCTAEACNLRDNYEALQTRGNNAMGPLRRTFIFDENGILTEIIRKSIRQITPTSF